MDDFHSFSKDIFQVEIEKNVKKTSEQSIVPVRTVIMEDDNDADNVASTVATLTAMGFSEDEAIRALQQSSGNLEYAANLLLMGGADGGAPLGVTGGSTSSSLAGRYNDRPPGDETEAAEEEDNVVLAAVSQYDLPEGRSACTCIALAAADSMLLQLQQQEQGDHNSSSTGRTSSSCSYWSTESLTACLYRGHEIYLHYQQQQQNGSSTTTTEHTSAEELLHLFPNLQLIDSSSGAFSVMIRQGLLTDDGSCWQELLTTTDAGPDGSTAYIITKPPETVLVYYDHHHNSSSSSSGWWLVDSHCRPPRFRQAYALRHETWSALQTSLQRLFPATPAIPGVAPIMMAMYNSVDVYPLRQSRPVAASGPTNARSDAAVVVTTTADDHNAET
jgi:UBA/TS-N domain